MFVVYRIWEVCCAISICLNLFHRFSQLEANNPVSIFMKLRTGKYFFSSKMYKEKTSFSSHFRSWNTDFPLHIWWHARLLFLHLILVGHRLSGHNWIGVSSSTAAHQLQLCIIPLQPNSFDTHWLTDPIDNIIKGLLDTNPLRVTHLKPPYIFLMCNLKRWKNEINRNVSC